MSAETKGQSPATIPPDNPERNLVLAQPDIAQRLPHIGLVGDTYTILLTGKDTAGRFCLIDTCAPEWRAASSSP
jgi:hypothetical protein